MKTPQEKKRLSYARDRRNTYGENSNASRKNIPLAKARANRAVRHTQDRLLAAGLNASSDGDKVPALARDWTRGRKHEGELEAALAGCL